MISTRLLSLVRCPACHAPLGAGEGALCCDACGVRYEAGGEFLDLRPHERFSEQTKYLDEALHGDARHETVSPPLLSAAVRLRMLRRFLRPSPGDRVLDLGCGSGRVLVWNEACGAYQAGVDVSPFFAAQTCQSVDLVLGDLRRLPFADGAFNKAYALDVFEHLSRDALRQVLDEIRRVLEPGGQMFVYSHVRKNAPLARGLRAINRLADRLERAGLMDLRQERLRKSDHVNPLADIPDLERVVGDAGFRIARIRYYTPLVAGFVENILLRMAEHRMARRARRASTEMKPCATASGQVGNAVQDFSPATVGQGPDDGQAQAEAQRAARATAKARIARGGFTYAMLRAITWALMLDVVLWGRVRTGPFFALLVKERGR